jgi:hypothetical protein
MQTVRIVQAVALILIVAMAASCSASKEYTSKLFAPRTPEVKDSQATALKFLDIDAAETDRSDWVSTDIIMGRDTNNTTALDNFSKTFPASPVAAKAKTDSAIVIKDTKPLMAEVKTPVADEPVAKAMNAGGVRDKKTREK